MRLTFALKKAAEAVKTRAAANAPTRRYLIWLSYVGGRSGFHALAKQPKALTVVTLLERVISETLRVPRKRVRLAASSRTDHGVHALRTSILADLPSDIPSPISDIRDPTDLTQWKSCWNDTLEDYGFADVVKVRSGDIFSAKLSVGAADLSVGLVE